MQLIRNSKKNNTHILKGFTLIELLVSIALFSVVLTITLGSIMTIVDSNKKARSLMSVTNNLNFAIDSMTRSFKSGEIAQGISFVSSNDGKSDNCFQTNEQDYVAVGDADNFEFRSVKYCWKTDNGQGKIYKYISSESNFNFDGAGTPITSSDIDITYLKFYADGFDKNNQPILTMVIEAEAKISEKITSQFTIQTSVSQLKLNN